MTAPEPVAHIAEDGRCQPLIEHLEGTAERAAQMAEEFGCAGWGRLIGLWHDLGKYSPDFQRYILAATDAEAHLEGSRPGRVDHSTAGALWAVTRLGPAGRILAYPVAGHHAGLPDWEADTTGGAALSQRLQRTELLEALRHSDIPADILDRLLPGERKRPGADPATWIRLLYSCLVDADFLDTEAFLDPDRAAGRGKAEDFSALLTSFSNYMQGKQADAPDTKVNRVRATVLSQCIAKAAGPPGIYTLTVPTGGGKTLSSMAFALHHAKTHNKRRIIYVIPYTSIIEQTADQFRTIFGEAVVEHHSNLDAADPTKDSARSRLACENWDAPIIVTTSVQFFESLFASRSSRCRKLHNIVNSVMVLDEVQLLPPDFLSPILHVLRELQNNYGVTLLLCTATQPALGPHKAADFDFEGLTGMVEIVDDPVALHEQLKRVEVHIPNDLNRPTSWDDLAEELRGCPSVLCVVNRRDDCRDLWERMPPGTFHLSALMCGAHRSKQIAALKERLKQGIPTRVISTQLVEAGVDVDFPVVYRAVAGLDSVAQAAGRCNREGLLDGKGKVVVFAPPSKAPPGHLRQAAQVGQRLMSQDHRDVLAPDLFEAFFRELYWIKGREGLDRSGILRELRMDSEFRCSFRSAAQKFHLIDDSLYSPVVVSYGAGAELISVLEREKPDRALMQKLQRYVVNLPRYVHAGLVAEGKLLELHPGIFVQGHNSLYDDNLGFCSDRSIVYGADELVI